jgi:hypothetical protein
MSLPVSPIRKLTKLDRIQEKDLYRAGDFQNIQPRWLHLSGERLTEDINYSWRGTLGQFKAICEKHEWDGLSLVPASIT